MRDVILIVMAGGLGALSRYETSGLAHRLFGDGFPYGTLAVNVIGSFLIGLVMQTSLSTDLVPPAWRLAVTVGFLGAFTTFSTFSYETLGYLEDGAWLTAGLNTLLNVLLAIVAVSLGVFLAKTLFGGA